MNPLLQRTTSGSPDSLLDFAAIRPEHIAPAVSELLTNAQKALDKVCEPSFPASWDQLSMVLDLATEQFGVAWGAISHLNGVADTPELRSAYNAALPDVTAFFTATPARSNLPPASLYAPKTSGVCLPISFKA